MSLMRYPVYVWADANSMHLWARRDVQEDEGVYDPVHRGEHGESALYPGFVSGVAMPLRVWDDIVTRYAAKRGIFINEIADPEQVAKAVADKVRTITLKPGEYAIVEMSDALTAATIEQLAAAVPDDLAGRMMFVDGEVHTLKPEQTHE